MPLVPRPSSGWLAWQASQETLPGIATGGPRSTLARGWPTELPPPGGTPALQAASLPRLPAQPGTLPVRGRPTTQALGLASPGVAPTGEPSMGGRSSVLAMPAY